jgi:glycosyltransferase involved in cell wall biosynthesis
LSGNSKVLAVTLEPVSKRMAGPAIRCVELAKQLAQRFDTTVFTPRPSDLSAAELSPGNTQFHLIAGTGKGTLYEEARAADVLFIQANVLKAFPLLARLDKYMVVDLYDPYLLAVLAQFSEDDISAHASYNLMHHVLEQHMSLADFSVCASERQRDYWMGRYCSLGRLTPEQYRIDRSFRKLIDVVPFGLPDEPVQRTGPGMKGVVPGIGKHDFVLLWGGGVWEWFDPLTIIKAVGNLVSEFPQLKLYFMGIKSPNPQVPLMEMAVRSKQLANDLNILDKNVFFNESWTSYEDRVNFLLDADAAVSAHFDLPETRFSFRTRILDYLWAGLPILTTCGDQLAEMIERHHAGEALNYEDVEAWTDAIRRMLTSEEVRSSYRQNSLKVAQEYQWQKVVKPLMQYCEQPYKLPKYKKVKMPSLVERARAVYSRGGKDLVVRRSRELFEDLLRK